MRESKDSSSGLSAITDWTKTNWRSLTVLTAIVLMALILRIFFAYGTSAGGGFALSGGSDAAYHLRVIEHILSGNGHIVTDPALNYPFGGLNYNPPLFDWSVAIAAYPLTLFGFSTAEAASIALTFSTAVVGALTCIPVYLLGREMFSRRAALVASAFFAISSVAIVKTVFSNGTESSYFVFFFILFTLFLLRSVKAMKRPDAGSSVKTGILAPFNDKAVFRNGLFAALSLTALMLSWIGFLAVIMLISVIMTVQAVCDRLRGQSAMAYVSLYGAVMLFPLLIVSIYYVAVMGMTMLIAGPLCLALLFIIVSFIISAHRVWVITFPLSIAIIAVFFTITAFFIPSLHGAMTSEFYPYAEGKFGSLITLYNGVTLSTQAIYAGMATMWFSFIIAGLRVIRMPKESGSPPYVFITVWFVVMLFLSWRNMDLAYLAAPMYAIGTGVAIVWIMKFANIKGYIASFKGVAPKSMIRKAIKPVPFLAVIGTVLMLLLPNVVYAVDASIPSNTKQNYSADMRLGTSDPESMSYLGATNYYIKDSDWSLSTAWDYYYGEPKDGALVSWLDYGAEAVANGRFDVVADMFGGGAAAASNMLLSTPSESIVAMTVRLLEYSPSSFDYLTAQNPSLATEIAGLKRIMQEGKVPVSVAPDAPCTWYVRMNPDIFGPTDHNISEENAMYLVASYYLTKELTDGQIAKLYNDVCADAGKSINYFGVAGSMLPLYYGDTNLFSTLAYMNDYYLDKNGTAPKYYWAGIPYYGYYYYYNDAMYETMIWKTLIGMTLEDYRSLTNDPNLSFSTLIYGLMMSDGTYTAQPGFGLANFDVDGWWVTYNSDNELNADWELLTIDEALKRQAADGGLINYLGGMVFLKYNGADTEVSGTVETTTSEPVGGMTVALFDSSGNLIGHTKTDENGGYSMMVKDYGDVAEVGVYCGSVYAMEVYRGPKDVTPVNNITVPWSELKGELSGLEELGTGVEDIMVELTGKYSGKTYTFNPGYVSMTDPAVFSYALPPGPGNVPGIVPDTYTAEITLYGVSLYSGTFTLYPGDINVGKIDLKGVTVNVTVRDMLGDYVPDVAVEIYDIAGNLVADAETNANGVATMTVAPGDYIVKCEEDPLIPKVLVSSSLTSNTTAFTARLGSTASQSVFIVDAAVVEIDVNNAVVSEGDVITLTNGAYLQRGTHTVTVIAPALPATSVSVYLPIGDYTEPSHYTATMIKPTVAPSSGDPAFKMWYAKIDVSALPYTIATSDWVEGLAEVEIKMTYKNADGDVTDTAGTVSLFDGFTVIDIPIVVPDENVAYTENVWLLPIGEYTVYAYASNMEKKAYLGASAIVDDMVLNIELVDAIAISGTARYTATSTLEGSYTRITYIPLIITSSASGLSVMSTSDASGFYVMLPKGTYTITTETLFGTDNCFMRPLSPTSVTVETTSARITVLANSNSGAGSFSATSYMLSGTVTDYVNGNALPGVTVEYEINSDGITRAVTADEDGIFRIKGVPAGATVEVTHLELDGYDIHSSTVSILPDPYNSTDTNLTYYMQPDGTTTFAVSGTVEDDAGNPLAAVISYTRNGTPSTVTAVAGAFSVTAGPSDVIVFTNIALAGYICMEVLPSYTVTNDISDVELMMYASDAPTSYSVSGRVLSSAFLEPLAGAEITFTLDGGTTFYTAYTGADGVYRVSGITSGDIFEVTDIVYAGFDWPGTWTAPAVTSDMTGVDLTMDEDALVTFALSGNVKGAGKWLPGMVIDYTVDDGTTVTPGTTTTAGTTGAFTISGIPAGSMVTITSVRDPAQNYVYVGVLPQTFTVTGQTTGVVLTMDDDPGMYGILSFMVAGTVTDLNNGNALPGVTVEYNIDGGKARTVTADENGVFKILGIPNGSVLEVTDLKLNGYDIHISTALPIQYVAMDTALAYYMEWDTTTTFDVSGIVKNVGGDELEGIDVDYTINGTPFTVTTAADGTFTITVDPSDVIAFTGLTDTSGEYVQGELWPSYTVTKDVDGIAFTMYAGDTVTPTYSVSGRILTAGTGEPLRGAAVISYEIDDGGTPVPGTVTADSNGMYRVIDIPDNAVFEIMDITYPGFVYVALPTPITITANNEFRVDIIMEGNGTTTYPLTGYVRDAYGAGIVGINVNYDRVDESGNVYASGTYTTTATTGAFTLTGSGANGAVLTGSTIVITSVTDPLGRYVFVGDLPSYVMTSTATLPAIIMDEYPGNMIRLWAVGNDLEATFRVTDASNPEAVKATVTLRNTSGRAIYALIETSDVKITTGTNTKEYLVSVSASSTATTTVNIEFDITQPKNNTVSVTAVSSFTKINVDGWNSTDLPYLADLDDIKVTLNNIVVGSDDQTSILAPGQYTLKVEPQTDVGYYYSGIVKIYAGQTSINLKDYVKEVAVVTIVTEDKDDTVTFSATGAALTDDSRTSETKVYYVPLNDDREFSGTIYVATKDGERIGYMDVAGDSTWTNPVIDFTDAGLDLLKEKATVSGYIGRASSGTMTITVSMWPSAIGDIGITVVDGGTGTAYIELENTAATPLEVVLISDDISFGVSQVVLLAPGATTATTVYTTGVPLVAQLFVCTQIDFVNTVDINDDTQPPLTLPFADLYVSVENVGTSGTSELVLENTGGDPLFVVLESSVASFSRTTVLIEPGVTERVDTEYDPLVYTPGTPLTIDIYVMSEPTDDTVIMGNTGTYKTTVSNGEYTAVLPYDERYTYSFFTETTDMAGTAQKYFTHTEVIDFSATGLTLTDKKAVRNFEVMPEELIPDADVTDVIGKITDADGNPMNGITVKYEVFDISAVSLDEGTVITNVDGNYVIKVTDPTADHVDIEASLKGYITVTPSVSVGSSGPYTEDITLIQEIIIDDIKVADNGDGTFTIAMEVTNNSDATVILTPGSGWMMPAFNGSVNYAIVPDGAVSYAVLLTASYNPDKGQAGLTVIARNPLGETLLMKSIDFGTIYQVESDVIDVTVDTSATPVQMAGGDLEFYVDSVLPNSADVTITNLSSDDQYIVVRSNNVDFDIGGTPVNDTVIPLIGGTTITLSAAYTATDPYAEIFVIYDENDFSGDPVNDLEISTDGNRVSKYEYGFAAEFTNTSDYPMELTISMDHIIDEFNTRGLDEDWYVSLVDSNNVKLFSNILPIPGNDITVTVDGQSTATYYVRLISIGEDPDANIPVEDMYLEYYDSGMVLLGEIYLRPDTTSLTTDTMTASGNNIFSSLDGMPTIVWVFLALSILLLLLIAWLGMRRGVFLRKR